MVCVPNFCPKSLNGRGCLQKTRHIWKANTENDLKGIIREIIDWIHLAQNSVQWPAVLHMVMSLGLPQKPGKFLTKRLLPSEEVLCSLELESLFVRVVSCKVITFN